MKSLRLILQEKPLTCGPAALMMVAEYYGIDCTMEELVERIPLPAIVLWTNNHYVVVDEADDSRIHVLDPARGSVWYSHEEFQSGWHQEDKQTGVLMAVEDRCPQRLPQGGSEFAVDGLRFTVGRLQVDYHIELKIEKNLSSVTQHA